MTKRATVLSQVDCTINYSAKSEKEKKHAEN